MNLRRRLEGSVVAGRQVNRQTVRAGADEVQEWIPVAERELGLELGPATGLVELSSPAQADATRARKNGIFHLGRSISSPGTAGQ